MPSGNWFSLIRKLRYRLFILLVVGDCFGDNPSRTIYTDNSTGMSLASDYGKIVNYYLFVGDKMDNLVAAYRSLTGGVPMLPDWALGYHQSRNRYATQKEVMEIAKKMKEKDILQVLSL